MIEFRGADGIVRQDFFDAPPATTNNKMALKGAIDGLSILGDDEGEYPAIVYHSDSQYLVKGITEWVHDWERRGWRRKGGEVQNLALWKALLSLSRRGDVRWRWVRGHAGHVKNDIPWELNSFADAHPEMTVRYARELAIEPKLLRVSAQRIEEAEGEAKTRVRRADSLLVVVGRGTKDPDANSNVAKIARMLWEGMGFGWAETAFSGVAHPGVDEALGRAARLGFGRIIVFPYFLFTGVLVKRILRLTQEAAIQHPEIEFLAAGYLKDHPLTIETLIERVHEIGEGANNMNCQLCKYRERVIGY